MRTREEIYRTPMGLLSDDEIKLLSPANQEFARKVKERQTREAACLKHEAVDDGSYTDHLQGWHPAHCKHCGADMSVDSSG